MRFVTEESLVVVEQHGDAAKRGNRTAHSTRGVCFYSARAVTRDVGDSERISTCATVLQICSIEGFELWVGRLSRSDHELPTLCTQLRPIGEPLDGMRAVRYFVGAGDADTLDWDELGRPTLRRLLADPVMRHLAASLASAIARPELADVPFAEFATAAVQAYVASRLTFLRTGERKRGGLAPWQQRKTSEHLLAHIGRQVPISELAALCRLSVSHFVRAFRESTGAPPHQWIVMRRIDLSKDLLVEDARRPLSEIALTCGFADQSHFTRTFSRMVGMTPGAWRRCSAKTA